MISKTKISKRVRKKTNTGLVKTILISKKKNLEIAQILSSPTRKRVKKNLEDVEKEVKAGERIIVPGKVLGKGKISKKIKIMALNFSAIAEEKLKKAGCEIALLEDELKKDKKLTGRILK